MNMRFRNGRMYATVDGRVWCLLHRKPWKRCPCPGEFTASLPIDQAVIDAMTPQPNALEEAFRAG